MRFFLGTHGAGFARFGIEQAGFLLDRAARLDHVDLPARFIFHRLGDEAHGIDVLDLAARAEFGRRGLAAPDTVDVGAHGAFVHVAVAGAQIAHDGAQFLQESRRFLAGAHVAAW